MNLNYKMNVQLKDQLDEKQKIFIKSFERERNALNQLYYE